MSVGSTVSILCCCHAGLATRMQTISRLPKNRVLSLRCSLSFISLALRLVVRLSSSEDGLFNFFFFYPTSSVDSFIMVSIYFIKCIIGIEYLRFLLLFYNIVYNLLPRSVLFPVFSRAFPTLHLCSHSVSSNFSGYFLILVLCLYLFFIVYLILPRLLTFVKVEYQSGQHLG